MPKLKRCPDKLKPAEYVYYYLEAHRKATVPQMEQDLQLGRHSMEAALKRLLEHGCIGKTEARKIPGQRGRYSPTYVLGPTPMSKAVLSNRRLQFKERRGTVHIHDEVPLSLPAGFFGGR